MSVDTASLLAQVIPTLLILVALEPRLRGEKARSSVGKWVASTGRESATVVSIISVGLCIYVSFTDKPNCLATIWVAGATSWLVVIATMLFGMMFGHEKLDRHEHSGS